MTRAMLRSIFRSSRAVSPPPPPPAQTALQQHNQAILHVSDVSHVTLPPMFVLWRHPNPTRSIEINGLTHNQAYSAACIATERIGGAVHPLWRFTLVEQPLEALGRCSVTFYPDNWLSGQSHKIIVQRPSPNPETNNKLYLTEVSHMRYAIRMETGQFVPILKLANPCVVLHSRFAHLDTTHMERFGFVCDHGRELIPPTLVRRGELQQQALQMAERAARAMLERTAPAGARPPVPLAAAPRRTAASSAPAPAPRATMPQHIVNTVIETLVAQEKECPILQTALEKETTCLTPCGHAMTTDAAARWIRDAHSCPECRSPCSVDQLQVWRA